MKKYPELEKVLEKFSGTITNEEMAEMNYKVEMKNIEASEVAKEFLRKKKLL